MDKVIIDTSAWIDSFRPKADKSFSLLVKDLVLKNRVLMPGIIKTELLRGTKTKSEFDRLYDLLKGITYLPAAEKFWDGLKKILIPLIIPMLFVYISFPPRYQCYYR